MQHSLTSPAAAAAIYLSQSECGTWQGCPAQAWARFVLGYRPPDDEDRPRRVGSMGHAVINDRVAARHDGRDADPHRAIGEEAERRGWSDDFTDRADEIDCAVAAAGRIAAHLRLDSLRVLPDVYSEDDPAAPVRRGPLSEVRLRVRWQRLAEFFTDMVGSTRVPSAAWRDIMRCEAVRARFAGIEGQPDLVCMPDGPDVAPGIVAVLDFKFRQSLDLGGAGEPDESAVPDKQAAWYLALLYAAGLRPAGGMEFWQVNAYAGKWLTVDDFIRIADGGATTEEEFALILDDGMPTRDLGRYKDARAAVDAATWAEAHRILANHRLERRLDEWRRPKFTPTGKPKKQGEPPDRLSATEEAKAREFIADLSNMQSVAVRKFRTDPSVSREVVRDMIVAVDGPLSHALRGIVPARILQSHRGSQCTKHFGGCPVRTPCLATIGGSNFESHLHDLKAQGALVNSHAAGPRLGSVPEFMR